MEIIIFLTILLIIILLAREFWCWYWKINTRIAELEKINANMEIIKSLLIHSNSSDFKNKESIGNSDEELPQL